MSKKKNKGKWSVQEEELLEGGLEAHGENWMKLASIVKTRDAMQVKNHVRTMKNIKDEDVIVNGLEQTHISSDGDDCSGMGRNAVLIKD